MSITKYGNWSVAFKRKSALKTAVLIRPGTGSTADAAGSRQKASGTQNKLFSAAIWCWTDSFITQRPTTSTTFHDNIAVTMTRRLTSNHVTTMFVDCAALFGTNLFYERTFLRQSVSRPQSRRRRHHRHQEWKWAHELRNFVTDTHNDLLKRCGTTDGCTVMTAPDCYGWRSVQNKNSTNV